jgi:hypothetical protein
MAVKNQLNITGSSAVDGAIPIGSTANGYAAWVDITSTGGTIDVTNGSHIINLEVDGAFSESFVTDAGTAVPLAGVLDILGAHNVNTSGATHIVTVALNNAITLGDLTLLTAGNSAITLTSGDITLSGTGTNAAGNINLPNTSTAGNQGEIRFNGNRSISNFGTRNFFVGTGSGNTTVTGADNFAGGNGAAVALTSGNSNVAVGSSAMSASTSGVQHVAVGFFALGQATGAHSGNTAIGYIAMSGVTTGSGNTAIGVSSGGSGIGLLTGDRNTYVGQSCGISYTSSEHDNNLFCSAGVIGDAHTQRLGDTGTGNGQVSTSFLAGTYGVTPGGTGIQTMVMDSTGQMGTQAGAPTILNYKYVTASISPYTVLAKDNFLGADVTLGAVTILLPNAPATGTIYTVKDQVGLAATSNITVTTVGGAVDIDGATSFVMNTTFQSISVLFDGTAYLIY